MLVPKWFEEQLHAEHGSKYRVRWSHARGAFLLEQKVARGITTPPERLVHALRNAERREPGITEEKLEQARSGYLRFMEIRPGTRAPCGSCGTVMSLRPNEVAWATCPTCQKNHPIVNMALGWALLEHLRYIDYERGGDERLLADSEREQTAVERGASTDLKNAIGSMAREDFNTLFNIPSVGYTGRVHPGTELGGPA